MESPPFPINITLNKEGDGAILHANPKSDARASRWAVDYEESTSQAKQGWLWKLGCLLKLHGNIEYIFYDPWAYSLADFPKNYKLFSAGRRDGPLRMDHYLYGGKHVYRSPHEFYPHLHWLLDNARGVRKECLCKYCSGKSQKEVGEIFPLPPNKKSPKGPRGPRSKKETRKIQHPKGVTTRRGLVFNRNSITTGPVTSLRDNWQEDRSIGYKTSRPFR